MIDKKYVIDTLYRLQEQIMSTPYPHSRSEYYEQMEQSTQFIERLCEALGEDDNPLDSSVPVESKPVGEFPW